MSDLYDADFNAELPAGDEVTVTNAHLESLGTKNRALATYNENKSVLWYVDDSGSMRNSLHKLNASGEPDYDAARKSRIEIARSTVEKLVTDRMEQFTGSKVAVFRFDGEVHRISRANSLDSIREGIRNLDARGDDTSLRAVFNHATSWCASNPNRVGMFHVMLVTDGEDGRFHASDYDDECMRLGIVVEVTVIGSVHNLASKELKLLAERTGGTFRMVSDASTMETALIDAGTRLCLPPAPGQ